MNVGTGESNLLISERLARDILWLNPVCVRLSICSSCGANQSPCVGMAESTWCRKTDVTVLPRSIGGWNGPKSDLVSEARRNKSATRHWRLG